MEYVKSGVQREGRLYPVIKGSFPPLGNASRHNFGDPANKKCKSHNEPPRSRAMGRFISKFFTKKN